MKDKKIQKQIGFFAAARGLETASKLAVAMVLAGTLYGNTNNALWVSLGLFALYGLPFFFSPIAGWMADKLDRKKIMVGSLLVASILYVLMAVFTQPVYLLILSALVALASAAYVPANSSLVPKLVPSENLPWANGKLAVGRNMGFLVGPALGGILVSVSNDNVAFLAVALSALASAFCVYKAFAINTHLQIVVSSSNTPIPTQGVYGIENESSPKIEKIGIATPNEKLHKEGVFAGIKWIKTQPFFLKIMASLFFIYAGLGLALPGEVVLADFFNAGPLGYGAIVCCWGIGNILGNIKSSKQNVDQELRLMKIGFSLFALGFIAVCFSPWFPLVLLSIIIGGYGEGLAVVSGQLLLQKRTPESVLGRTYAVQEAVTTIGFAIPVLLSGLIISGYGVKTLYLIAGITCLIGTAVLFATSPKLKRLFKWPKTVNLQFEGLFKR